LRRPRDPVSALRHALWLSGARWAGKATVAGILTERYALACCRHDDNGGRGHQDRWPAARLAHLFSVNDVGHREKDRTPDPGPNFKIDLAVMPRVARCEAEIGSVALRERRRARYVAQTLSVQSGEI
jgi:hypothetical protein